jgi:hypothetical protein
MYKKIETDKYCIWGTNYSVRPVATLSDERNHKIQIIIDRDAYVILFKLENGTYITFSSICNEVFDVLKTLPSPSPCCISSEENKYISKYEIMDI